MELRLGLLAVPTLQLLEHIHGTVWLCVWKRQLQLSKLPLSGSVIFTTAAFAASVMRTVAISTVAAFAVAVQAFTVSILSTAVVAYAVAVQAFAIALLLSTAAYVVAIRGICNCTLTLQQLRHMQLLLERFQLRLTSLQ